MGVLPIGLAPEQSSTVIEVRNDGAPATPARHAMRTIAWLLLVTLAAPIPRFAPPFAGAASVILVFALLGTALALEIGLAGMPDFAVTAHFAAGAYAMALISQLSALRFWECLPLCGAICALIALVIAAPLVRRTTAVFAMVTLSFSAVLQVALANSSRLTGGADGLGFPPTADRELYYYVALGISLCAAVVAWRLRRSPIALALRAARENEIACHSIGINPRCLKLTIITVAGAMAGIAGGLWATGQGHVRPDQFDLSTTATVLAVLLLGGAKSQLRLSVAAILVIGIPLVVPAVTENRLLIFGIALALSPLLRRWAFIQPSLAESPISVLSRTKSYAE